MKTIKYFFLVLFIIPLIISCDEDGDIAEITTELLVLENISGQDGCGEFTIGTVTFYISYRDIDELGIDILPGNRAFLPIGVSDGNKIIVKVKKTDDNTLLADADIIIRTDSRPDNLEDTSRTIFYCTAFNLIFENF